MRGDAGGDDAAGGRGAGGHGAGGRGVVWAVGRVWAGAAGVLRKDLLLAWRSPGRLSAVGMFAVLILLMFSFAASDTSKLRGEAPGYYWLAILLSSTLYIADTWRTEMQNRALEGLRLIPIPAAGVFFGKSVATMALLGGLGMCLIPVMIALYDITIRMGLPAMVGVLILGVAGLAAPGMLYGLLSARVRSGEVLLPLLLFPLEVPVLLASTRATTLVITGDPMQQLGSWVGLLIAFNLIFWSLCGLLFGRLLEE